MAIYAPLPKLCPILRNKALERPLFLCFGRLYSEDQSCAMPRLNKIFVWYLCHHFSHLQTVKVIFLSLPSNYTAAILYLRAQRCCFPALVRTFASLFSSESRKIFRLHQDQMHSEPNALVLFFSAQRLVPSAQSP